MKDSRLTQHGDIALARARFVMLRDLAKQGMDAIDVDAIDAAGEILERLVVQASEAEHEFIDTLSLPLDDESEQVEQAARPHCVPHLKL